MAELVSKRYAISIFEAGLELEKIDLFFDELKFLEQVFKLEEKLFEIINNPRITKSEKKSLVTEIFKDKLSQEMLNFIYIIIDKGREKYIFDIIAEYGLIYSEHKNILNVEATTAIAMDEKLQEKLRLTLEKKLNKQIIISNKVDTSIIGGVLLKMNDKVIDSTLSNQLKNMEVAINNIAL